MNYLGQWLWTAYFEHGLFNRLDCFLLCEHSQLVKNNYPIFYKLICYHCCLQGQINWIDGFFKGFSDNYAEVVNLDVRDGRAWDQQEASIKEEWVADKPENKISPFVDLLGFADKLNEGNDTALKASLVWRYHIVRGHDVAYSRKHTFVSILFEFLAYHSVEESRSDSLDPCWNLIKIYVQVGCFVWDQRFCS